MSRAPRSPGRQPLLVVLCVALCMVCSSAAAHDNSRSRSLVVLEPGQLTHFVKLQAQSVWEVLPLDPDGNLLVEPDEFEAVREDLGRYVREHVRLRPDGAVALDGALVGAELVSDDADALAFQQWIELELRYDLTDVPRELEIEVSLFRDTSPRHQDLCDVVWADGPQALGAESVRLRFWAGDPRQLANSGRPLPTPPLSAGLWSGARGLLLAPLALLCLAALLVGAASVGSSAAGRRKVIWAFTGGLAASVGAAGPLAGQLSPGAVTLAGGLAVAWVGALNLAGVVGSPPATRGARPVWAEALVFGLLMGLGPASGQPSASPPWSLAAGAAAVAQVTGWALSALLSLPGVAAPARLLVSPAAILLGGWAAWSILVPA